MNTAISGLFPKFSSTRPASKGMASSFQANLLVPLSSTDSVKFGTGHFLPKGFRKGTKGKHHHSVPAPEGSNDDDKGQYYTDFFEKEENVRGLIKDGLYDNNKAFLKEVAAHPERYGYGKESQMAAQEQLKKK